MVFEVWQESTKAVKVGTRRTCTHAVCTRWPLECCDPGHNVLRRHCNYCRNVFRNKLKQVVLDLSEYRSQIWNWQSRMRWTWNTKGIFLVYMKVFCETLQQLPSWCGKLKNELVRNSDWTEKSIWMLSNTAQTLMAVNKDLSHIWHDSLQGHINPKFNCSVMARSMIKFLLSECLLGKSMSEKSKHRCCKKWDRTGIIPALPHPPPPPSSALLDDDRYFWA